MQQNNLEESLYYPCRFCASWKPNSKPKEKDDIIQNGKGALYDELSIPFIDASPTNTPNVGRSRENLGSKSFFNRTPSIGRSRGSLSSKTNNQTQAKLFFQFCCFIFFSFSFQMKKPLPDFYLYISIVRYPFLFSSFSTFFTLGQNPEFIQKFTF